MDVRTHLRVKEASLTDRGAFCLLGCLADYFHQFRDFHLWESCELIRLLRNELGWSQEQAAARCNVVGFDISRASYAQIESQIRSITDHELALLAKAFRVAPDKLLPDTLPPWTGKGRKDTWKSRKRD